MEVLEMNHIDISLKLEAAFRLFSDSFEKRRNDFAMRPTETIREGFELLYALGIIGKEDFSIMRQTYDFGSASLANLLVDAHHQSAFQDLLGQLQCLAEKYNQ